MSFRFIEDHRDAYPVRLMCAALEVSRAGYYACRGRPQSTRATGNATLLAEIRQAITTAVSAMAVRGSMPFWGRRDVVPAEAGSNA